MDKKAEAQTNKTAAAASAQTAEPSFIWTVSTELWYGGAAKPISFSFGQDGPVACSSIDKALSLIDQRIQDNESTRLGSDRSDSKLRDDLAFVSILCRDGRSRKVWTVCRVPWSG